ncbi:MAG: tRNA preQ1(34) S-adenosylmethionine ribosyltransferase-isomerase QueA [Verrucomicrobiales bacterium]|nr:tRNA preQ1(34) S-adenosylmethionine ribosyltransferase-isomerase QueA [Verrucomicrobiales bacterium]
MQTSDFDYYLPDELIAQRPPERRGDSRMMVVDRAAGTIEHRQFSEFPSLVKEDDLLVFNDTKVVPARYFSNDGSKELLRVDVLGPNRWKCLVRPGKRLKPGRTIEIGDCTGTVVDVCEEGGERIIEFDRVPDEGKYGHLALPPYIERPDEEGDRDRYQTVFAREAGAIAAPTAGLHFSAEMLESIPHEFVTLHVGVGTFRPVSVDKLSEHHMHSETYELRPEVADRIESSGRTFAIGTTVVRVLESCAKKSREAGSERLMPGRGDTEIFIYPPYQFQSVDALLTNFHLPKSTLLMLVSAFAGKDLVMEAYRKAVEEKYRFFSYGDCMVLV